VYFVTICTHRHILRLGDVVDRQMRLNAVGLMIAEHWSALPQRFTHVSLDQFVVMPNHLHAILIVARTESDARVGPPLVGVPVRAGTRPAPTGACDAPDENVGTSVVGAPGVPPSLGDIIGAVKSLTTVEYSRGITSDGWRKFRTRLWQRNYFNTSFAMKNR
jgi:REP element-mobilizing transposase RayT